MPQPRVPGRRACHNRALGVPLRASIATGGGSFGSTLRYAVASAHAEPSRAVLVLVLVPACPCLITPRVWAGGCVLALRRVSVPPWLSWSVDSAVPERRDFP